jgi:predicted Zn-dependent peptidase
MGDIQTHTFPNGFRVIYEPARSKSSITRINVFCRVGSVYEIPKLRGVSHFIEHMCFKGTRRLPTTEDIFGVYDDIGAYFNAYTEKQYTCYVSAFNSTHAKKCISTMSDMLLHSEFDKREYEKELNVVIEENVSKMTEYDSLVSDLHESMVYDGSNYSYPVDSIKYHRLVDAWDYADVIEFYHKYYVPENMLLSIVSSMPFSEVLHIIRETDFSKTLLRKTPVIEPIQNIQPRMSLTPQYDIRIQQTQIKGLNTTYILWGFRTCSIFSEDKHSLELLSVILGGKFTSRLNTLLRETHGLTYVSSVSTNFYEHSGDITIYAVTDNMKLLHNNPSKRITQALYSSRRPPKRANTTQHKRGDLRGVLPLIADMIRSLLLRGVSDSEIRKAKQFVNGSIQMNMETSKTQVEYNGTEWFLGNTENIIPYHKLYERTVDPITKTQLHNVIRKYFVPENTNVAILGGNLPSRKTLSEYCARSFQR